jgi:hypothetical protein
MYIWLTPSGNPQYAVVCQLFGANMCVSLPKQQGTQHTHNQNKQPSQTACTTYAQPSHHGLLLVIVVVVAVVAANILAQQQW